MIPERVRYPGARFGEGVHVTPTTVRFRDTDAFGHVNNVVFGSWVEVARIAFLRGLEPPSGELILARLAIDYLRQVHFPEEIEVETRVAKIGTTSIALDQVVFASGERAAHATSVIVLYDYAAMRKRPVPDEFRAALTPYLRPDMLDESGRSPS